MLNITGAKVMGRVAQFGVYVEIVGTLGIALILLVHGFHHGLGFLFTTQGVQDKATNPLGLNFDGSWFPAAALIAVLAPVYIFYGFESCWRHRRGDEGREPEDPEGDALGADLGRDHVVHPHRLLCCSRCRR